MIRAVIFDLYGTLLQLQQDSKPYFQLAQRCSHGNVRTGIEIALTTENPRLGDFASRIGLRQVGDLHSLEVTMQDDIASTRPYSDSLPTLRHLKELGIGTGVISNLATPYKQPYFDHELAALIDVAVFSCDCGLIKPDSRIYHLALKLVGTRACETLMVGDSFKSDVQGPSMIGIKGIHLDRSGGAGKSHIISSLHAILEKVAQQT